MSTCLTAYWITDPADRTGLGYGVTAFSVPDALRILRAAGIAVPDDPAPLVVTENVSFADLDPNHVVLNMGPMVVRGVWYPCLNIGWQGAAR